MSGVGGPLLCIGDLLSDVGEDGDFTIGTVSDESTNSGTAQQLNNLSDPNKLHPSHLPQLFQVRLVCLPFSLLLLLFSFILWIFIFIFNFLVYIMNCFVCVEFVTIVARRIFFFIGFIIYYSCCLDNLVYDA